MCKKSIIVYGLMFGVVSAFCFVFFFYKFVYRFYGFDMIFVGGFTDVAALVYEI
jgi:hypothetical protein